MDDATMNSGGGNGYDKAVMESLLRDLDRCDSDLESLRGEYMQQCRGVREEMRDIFKTAKDAGIPVRPFKMIVKNRRLDKKMAANVLKLEDDDVAKYDAIVAGLGDFCDLPLGQAALRRARPEAEASLNTLA